MVLDYVRVTEGESEEGKIAIRDFMPDFRKGYLRVGKEKVVIPEYYLSFADALDKMEVREEDVYVASHPKTGTTWCQEMVWCIGNDLNYEAAKQFLPERFPFLEHSTLFDYTDILPRIPDLKLPPFVSDSVKYVDSLPSPRFIKTHLPWSLLPEQIRDGDKKPKIIYVARNAKDTCLSYFHHCKLLEGYEGNFEDFCKLFLGDTVCFAPFWSHVLTFWNLRHEPNVLFLKFQDMKTDLPSVIRKTADFLGKPLTPAQVDSLAEHLNFKNMRDNPAVNYEEAITLNRKYGLIKGEGSFMRKGEVDEWKGGMSPQTIARFDAWSAENLEGTGLTL